MRLKSLAFAGYRSFGARTPAAKERALEQLRLAPLVILLGKNNSGKSTVGKLLHHVLLALGADSEDPFPMQDGSLNFGSTFRDIQHGENFFSPLDLLIELESDAKVTSTLEVQLNQIGDLNSDAAPIVERCRFDGKNIPIYEGHPSRGLLPDVANARALRQESRQLLDASCRILPVRDQISKTYTVEKGFPTSTKPSSNQTVAQLLLADVELRNAVGAWMAEHLDGWRIDVKQSLDVFNLVARRGGRETNLANAGQGIQQVLPIITLSCWRQLGRGATSFLDVIEQPELHLHDAAHAPIGDLLLGAVATGSGTLVVETHSEAVVLRIRRRIAEGLLDPKRISIVYVEDLGDGSRLREIPVTEDGGVDWWPEGIFSESFVEVKAIRQAQRKSRN